MAHSIPNEIHSLWIGDQLGPLELVCLTSWIEQGHKAVLWRYEALNGEVPPEVEIRDASLVAPRQELVANRRTGSWALGANLFRYKLLMNQAATWCDLDVLLLKPMDLKKRYLFGWEHETSINNAILRTPVGEPLLQDMIDLYMSPTPIPPWAKPSRRIYYRVLALFGRARTKEEFAWGTFGPRALTYYSEKRGLQGEAAPTSVYYPVPCQHAHMMMEAGSQVESFLGPDSTAVHIWASHVRHRIMAGDFSDDSWFARQCQRLGVSV